MDSGRRPALDRRESGSRPGWKWGSDMSVRDRYIGVFEDIYERYGEEHASYIIEKAATLEDSIGYTREYVIESNYMIKGGKDHLRYDYYRRVLEEAARKFDFVHPEGKIVHVDLGCGPGLFAWVVHDYVMDRGENKDNLSFYLYDHSENMIGLAKKFWERLLTDQDVEFLHDAKTMRNRLRSENLEDCDVLVTFGYVLIQTLDNDQAMSEFSCIIRGLFPSRSCTMVAVDACGTHERRVKFKNSCKNLLCRLRDLELSIEKKMGLQGSSVYARLTLAEK